MALTLTRQDDTAIIGAPQTVTGATNATPIVMTVTAHGYNNGDFVSQTGIGGNTAANGTFRIANKTTNTYELTDPSTGANVAGNGTYTSGGTATRISYFVIKRGVPSAHLAVKIKNTGATAVPGAFVTLYAERTPGSGLFVSSGQPHVDEQMGRFEITGQDSTATPGQEIILGVVQVMGHLAIAELPTIRPGNWILADVWMEQSTTSAAGGAANVRFEISQDRKAVPISDGISEIGTGVLTGVKQAENFLISGGATTATGTPDDEVHTAVRSWLLAGVEDTDATIRDTAFNQNDGAASALTAGQKYIAVLTQGSADQPTVTKGLRATTPVKPTPPTGEIFLAWITVNYSAGATVINPGDIESDLTYGRLLVTAGSGLNAIVHAGRAIVGGFMQIHSAKETVALTASATNRIWLTPLGLVVKTLSDTPPSVGAHWLANAVTDATTITSIVDKRTFVQTPGSVTAHASSHATAGGDPVSAASIGAAAAVHSHAESDVTNLVTDLVAKAPTASPTFTGIVTMASQVSTGSQTRQVVTKTNADSPYAVGATDYVILANTSGGNLTITLPASPAQGRWLEIKNIQGGTNILTVDRNGKNIDSSAANFTTSTNNLSRTFVYDATFGWALM